MNKAAIRWLLAVALAAAGTVVRDHSPAVAADPPYPSTVPDFAHPQRPHAGDHQPTNGRSGRPVLVIAVQFSDEPWPAAKTDTWINARFFGPAFPSVRGYFRAQSRNHTDLWPGAETQARANDGVLRVNVGSRDAFLKMSEPAQHGLVLKLADPSVDYARYDINRDRRITNTELAIVPLWQDKPGDGGCGATRNAHVGHELDGVSLDGFPVALVGNNTNLETAYHEFMHATFGMPRDWYSYGIDGYDPMMATCGVAEFQVAVGSWNAMHLGWHTPTVVTRDGYQDVMRWDHPTLSRSFLLYDPAKGVDDYFLVEHRRRGEGGYDNDAGDTGLNVWRLNEKKYWDDPSTKRLPLSRIRPCGEPRTCAPARYTDAWDPTDATTPQRDIDLRWEDGTASRLAMRAVGEPRSNGMQRVYFDVPGPGALVDCFDKAGPNRQRVASIPAGESGALRLPIQNTGDGTASISTVLQSPWSSRTGSVTLTAKERTTGLFPVDVPGGTTPGRYSVVARVTWQDDERYGSYCYATVDVTAPRSVRGYLYSPQPSSSTPPAVSQFNSTGATNTVTRLGVGQYTVRFPGLGVLGGTVQAVAHHRDLAGATCAVGGWYPQSPVASGPNDLAVTILCYNSAGQPTDSGFSAAFARPLTAERYGHVWADQPTGAAYTPDRTYQFNATGAVNTINRTGVGAYSVKLPGLGNGSGGTITVSSYGGAAACRSGGWFPDAGAISATVLCDRAGTPVDHRFTLTYADRTAVVPGAAESAYVWVDQPSVAQSTPSADYQHTSAGGVITVNRTAVGYYTVNLPGVGMSLARQGWATVTPYGGTARCKLDGLYPDTHGQRALVWCHDQTGRGVDSRFTVSFVNEQA